MGTLIKLSNDYQHGKVWMVSENLCVLVLWTKVALALEGLRMPGWPEMARKEIIPYR